jgi:hypothetical protein
MVIRRLQATISFLQVVCVFKDNVFYIMLAGFMSNNIQHQWMPPASPMATSAQMHYPFQMPPQQNAAPINGTPHTSSTDNISPIMDTPWPKGAVIKPSPKFPRPQKIPGKNQFRDEIVIRNADSGKSMCRLHSLGDFIYCSFSNGCKRTSCGCC